MIWGKKKKPDQQPTQGEYRLIRNPYGTERLVMIWVTFQRAGFHAFPAAGTDPAFSDVSYLAARHRHLFKFKVGIEVFHDDRDVEFHQFLKWLESLYDNQQASGTYLELDNQSCEMMARELFQTIRAKYPNRVLEIDVSEDGEVGCTLR